LIGMFFSERRNPSCANAAVRVHALRKKKTARENPAP
jgi:hypothetical protein